MNRFEDKIEGVVDRILEDYRSDRAIDQMDIFRHPDKDVVVELIDKLRCRNGNLEITVSKSGFGGAEL